MFGINKKEIGNNGSITFFKMLQKGISEELKEEANSIEQ